MTTTTTLTEMLNLDLCSLTEQEDLLCRRVVVRVARGLCPRHCPHARAAIDAVLALLDLEEEVPEEIWDSTRKFAFAADDTPFASNAARVPALAARAAACACRKGRHRTAAADALEGVVAARSSQFMGDGVKVDQMVDEIRTLIMEEVFGTL